MRSQPDIFVDPRPQLEVASKNYFCYVTSRWGCEQKLLLLRDLTMRLRAKIIVAPWPHDEVAGKNYYCSVTSRWGRIPIFLLLRDLNMRSRTNISNISQFLLLLKNRFQNKNHKIEVLNDFHVTFFHLIVVTNLFASNWSYRLRLFTKPGPIFMNSTLQILQGPIFCDFNSETYFSKVTKNYWYFSFFTQLIMFTQVWPNWPENLSIVHGTREKYIHKTTGGFFNKLIFPFHTSASLPLHAPFSNISSLVKRWKNCLWMLKIGKSIQKNPLEISLFRIFFPNLLGVWKNGRYKWQKQLIQWTIGLRVLSHHTIFFKKCLHLHRTCIIWISSFNW